MKKLMILGGSHYVVPVIRAAHDLGVYVITADYLPNNIAHQYSDEYCNVSVTELDATLRAARDRGIDGVTSFACDPGVLTAAYVAEKLGLPSVGSFEAVSILQNKRRFRAFLAEHGFNVPRTKGYSSVEAVLRDADLFRWPVIVKPTDSAGSKGIRRAEGPDGLRAAVRHALSYSRGNEVIVEDFIAQSGFASDTDCFSVDGKLAFVSFNAQRFDAKAENPYVPAAYSWPSAMAEEHRRELTAELQRLITLLGLGTSLYNVETRVGTDGKAYLMECSPRGGGNRLAECLERAAGVRLIDNTVRAALGLPLRKIEQLPCRGHWAEVILHSNTEGEFERLWISEAIRSNVVECDLWVKAGDWVERFSAANKALGTLLLKFDSRERLNEVLDDQESFFRVELRRREAQAPSSPGK